jgi:hypothetical protein
MALDLSDLKPFIRLVSALVGLALLVLSCAGFHRLSQTSGALEGQASFGCMCFLGVLFGTLLFFGESKWERFFFLFGFMRYRIGRAVVFTVAGIMIAIIGKNMNDACRCQTYLLLIIEGIACLACAVLQILGVFVYTNNTSHVASKPVKKAAPSIPQSEASAPENSYVPPTPNKQPPPMKATPRSEATFEPVVPAPTHGDGNSTLPGWMRA